MALDKKALKILMDHYWVSGQGWKSPSEPAGELIEYAEQAGYMFDEFVTTHDALVSQLIAISGRIKKSDAANAFLASLSTRRLDLRSALSSYAVASHFPAHKLASTPTSTSPYTGAVFCSLCSAHEIQQRLEIDRNVLNFERFKWGGVRKIDAEYVWFDLTQFERAEKLEPTEEDYSIFREILSVCSQVPANERATSLARRLSGVFKSNVDERRSLIETLGICGILKPADRPTFFEGFVESEQREHTGEHLNDWIYPVIWWRGSDGVNTDALRHFFPEL